jgi:hypothetical protein
LEPWGVAAAASRAFFRKKWGLSLRLPGSLSNLHCLTFIVQLLFHHPPKATKCPFEVKLIKAPLQIEGSPFKVRLGEGFRRSLTRPLAYNQSSK